MKSFRLKTRKHRSRKLRKGGNGPSSSSSSQVSFQELYILIYQLKGLRGLLIEEEMDPGTNDPEELKEDIERNVETILSIFNGNKINLSQLTDQQTDELLQLIIGITDNFDEDNEEIDNQIVEAYAQAYLRYKDTHNSSLLEIEYLNNEIEEKNNLIEMIETGEDDAYDNDEDKEEAVQMYQNQIENIQKIRDIFIAEKKRMVNTMSFLPKEKDPGLKALSTDRGLLPDPQVAHVMSYLIPNYKNKAEEPTQHSTVISNSLENIKTMPSRSEKGGRRRSRKIRSRKIRRTMRRKSIRRK
jgi:hypothetical protein